MANKSRILSALGEAREDLILNKYNDAMMLMAQITIDVIEHLTDEALIVSKGYEEDLKTLKATGSIEDDTAHNFETLIISGVQAHNGVDIPKEHAEQALQVLTNELDYIFGKNDKQPDITENLSEKARFNATNQDVQVFEYDGDEEEPYAGDFSKDMTVDGSTPAFLQKGEADGDFRKKERMREQMLASQKQTVVRKKSKLIAIIIPIVLLLLLVSVVKAMLSSGNTRTRTNLETEPITEEMEYTEESSLEPTEPPAPPEAGYYDVTGNGVKIRSAATTEGSKTLAVVDKGRKIWVKSFYNNDWALVIWDGNEAYISRRYIEKDETMEAVINEQ